MMGEVYIKVKAPKLRKEVNNMAEQGKSSTRAKNKYNAKAYDRIALQVKKGKRELIREYANSKGESVNGFINRAIDETMLNDSKKE